MKRNVIVIVFGLLVLLPISFACAATPPKPSVTDQVKKCADIADPKARLECFDAVARALAQVPAAPPVAAGGAGKWVVSKDTNPLDDTQTIILILTADEGVSKWNGRVTLVLRCQSRATEAYINWGDYLGSEAVVSWRSGSAEARAAKWEISTDKKATFYPDDDVAFIRELLAADKLVARVTPYNESPVTAEFDLRGLAQVIAPLMETCGWK